MPECYTISYTRWRWTMQIEAAIWTTKEMFLPGATEVLGKENEVSIAKIAWLSRKDQGKAYGSMVVYVTKGSEAVRLLQGQYFHVAGESAYTGVYEHRVGPTQCYNCQEIDTRRMLVPRSRYVRNAPRKATAIKNARKELQNVRFARTPWIVQQELSIASPRSNRELMAV